MRHLARGAGRRRMPARAWLRALCLCAVFAGARAAVGDEFVLTRAGWPQHANGPNILALPAVRQTLRHFDESGVSIIIRHPGGDAGMQWARELHDWLVAFGVPTEHLELQPGAGAGGRLVVEVGD